jgi:hypothetical protein
MTFGNTAQDRRHTRSLDQLIDMFAAQPLVRDHSRIVFEPVGFGGRRARRRASRRLVRRLWHKA